MKKSLLYSAVVSVTLALSGPLLAGKGGGGTGGPGYQGGFENAPGQDMATQRRSDKALQQDRDRERYRGPEAERQTQKQKAKELGTGPGYGDQLRSREQERLRDPLSED